MNPNLPDNLSPDERNLAAQLTDAAQGLAPDEHFVLRTEAQLRAAFVAKKETQMKRTKQIFQFVVELMAVVALGFGLNWLVKSVAPKVENTPIPALAPVSEPTATPLPTATPPAPAYQWNGMPVYMEAPFPESPAEAGVYTQSDFPAVSAEAAQALADRFGVKGQVYQIEDYSGAAVFIVTDGRQRVRLDANGGFSFYPDFTSRTGESPSTIEQSAPVIDAFLKKYGFDFNYEILPTSGMGPGWFYIVPKTLDGREIYFDFGLINGVQIRIDSAGQVAEADVYMLNVNQQPVGSYGIISAEEAWNKVTGNAPLGVLMSVRGASLGQTRVWHRDYPLGQPLVFYGNPSVLNPAVDGQSPLVLIDSVPVTGNIAGLEKLDPQDIVAAAGQFSENNGIRSFNVNSWQVFKATDQFYEQGTILEQGGKIGLSTGERFYPLTDLPSDLPLPLGNVAVTGMRQNSGIEWQALTVFDALGGGGGGGGSSFAKLNLNGAPVPWPTLAPTPIPEPTQALVTGEKLEGLEGVVMVTILQRQDGSTVNEYGFTTESLNPYLLEGDLSALDAYNNRPVKIWGTVTAYTGFQTPIVTVERYEFPYPDVNFEYMFGTQEGSMLDGQPVLLFHAENGLTYVTQSITGMLMAPEMMMNSPEERVAVQGLVIPGKTVGGLPVIRTDWFSVAPKGEPFDTSITADRPMISIERPGIDTSSPPTLTIDSVKLVYYTPDPRYGQGYPDAMTSYLQPVWLFTGRYNMGDFVFFYVQALQDQFLLPEPAPGIQGG
jgi:hypothetical protein